MVRTTMSPSIQASSGTAGPWQEPTPAAEQAPQEQHTEQPAAAGEPHAPTAPGSHTPQAHAAQDHATQANTAQSHSGDSHSGDSHATDSHAAGKSTMEQAMSHYLDVGHLFEHVQDAEYIEFPKFLGGKVYMPNLLGVTKEKPLVEVNGYPLLQGRFTKFMALELVGAALLLFFFITAARKVRQGEPAKGRIANLLETIVVYIRDEIARPAIGHKDASRFLPFLLTLFFFILILNLIGMLPWFGSVTGSISVTAVLAVLTFLVVVGSGMKKMGVVGFLKAQVPHMDLPPLMALFLVPGIWLIEIFGLVVKHFVLAIRLFANMFGGHLVLAAFMAFAGVGVAAGVWGWGISLGAIAFSIAFSLLELLVAFLQAYIFTFLAALFIGSAQHAH